MTTEDTTSSSKHRWFKVLVAWVSFVIATAVVSIGFDSSSDSNAAPLLRAIVVFAIVTATIAVLHRRDRNVLGLRDPKAALKGCAVVAASAAVVFFGDWLIGGTSIESINSLVFVQFIATTIVIAGLQEAIPEELAFRGSIFGRLQCHYSAFIASLLSTLLFVIAPGTGLSLASLFEPDGPKLVLAPEGQDHASYIVLLLMFGTMLTTARWFTRSTFACMSAHISFLLINRVFISGDATDTGVVVTRPEGIEVLVLIYLLVAIAVFVVLGKRRNRSHNLDSLDYGLSR